MLTFTNITLLKQLERSLQEKEDELRLVLERMPVMLAALGPDRTLCVWNSECERVTGYRADEVIGHDDVLARLVPDVVYRAELLAEHRRQDGLIRNWTARIICKNGETKTIAFSNVSKAVVVPGWADWGIATLVTDEIDRKA